MDSIHAVVLAMPSHMDVYMSAEKLQKLSFFSPKVTETACTCI